MDIVHHTFIGGVGFIGFAANEHEIAGMAFVAGSVLPDLDVAFMAFGKRAYLKNHQGLTHSFLLAPLLALSIALLFAIGLGFDWTVYFAALTGLLLHSILDYCNTFGITLFWPLSRKRYCIDAVFFIDSVAWLLTVIACITWYSFDSDSVVGYYFLLLVVYISIKAVVHSIVKRRLSCDFLIPSAFNPFDYYVLTMTNRGYETAVYSLLGSQQKNKSLVKRVDERFYHLAERSKIYKDMQSLARCFVITEVNETEGGIGIVARDIAIRNFGGKFAETHLEFDNDGKLLSEMAHI